MHVKLLQTKKDLLKMCGPQSRLCLFTFRPIASKHLDSLTTIVSFSCLGGAVVKHPLSVLAPRVRFPVTPRVFMFDCFVLLLLCFDFFCPKTHYLSFIFAISMAMLIYLVYLTHCKMCDRL